MDPETYRVDMAFEVLTERRDPAAIAEIAARLAAMLPGSRSLRVEGPRAMPDGLAHIAATVRARGPAQALRDVSRTVELIAAERGTLDEVGPMRRTVVEYIDA
ncbi:MAG TPA: hypothetical protein VH496_18380 [Mycobacterium sp.]